MTEKPLIKRLWQAFLDRLVEEPRRQEADWDARYARGEDPSPDEPGGPARNVW